LYYEPYPSLKMPTFSPLLGMAMLGLIVPGVLKNFGFRNRR
jgi:hypothetical protein